MERVIGLYRRWGDVLFALFALIIVLMVLFWGTPVGLSDNADFSRVMDAASLSRGTAAHAFVFVDTFEIRVEEGSLLSNVSRILFSADGLDAYPSIHVFFVRLSVAANLVLNRIIGAPLTVYRLGILGAATALAYVGLIFALFRQLKWDNIWAEIVVKSVLLVILCDIGYISYFNSLYSESIQILAFLMILIFAIRLLVGRGKTNLNQCDLPTARGTLWDFIWFALSAVLFGWSKFINLPISVLLILAFGAIFLIRNRAKRPTILKTCGVGLAGVLILVGVYVSIPDWMDFDTNYNSVFFGIVKDVDEEEAVRHLEALGLSAEMAEFSSTNAYVSDARARFYELGFEEEFQSVTKFGLLWFYVRHPGLLMDNLAMSIAHSGQIRPWYLSNYPPDYGRFVLSNRFSIWTHMRSTLAFDTVYGNLILWAGLVTLFITALKDKFDPEQKKWVIWITLAAFLGSGAYALGIQMVANGEGDLAKHMFVYAQFVDVIFALLIAWLVYSVARLIETKRIDIAWRALPALLAIAVLLTPIFVSAVRTPRHVASLHDAQVGDLVQHGSYQGRELRWLVVEQTENTTTLFAMNPVAHLAFCSENRNDWTNSEIRYWLNTVFLTEALSDSDVLPRERPVFLSVAAGYRSEAGDRELYTFHIPRYAARGLDRAYREYVVDHVRLPDIALASRLLVQGGNIGGGFWLETPLYRNVEMVRYVSADRYILMKDAFEPAGVRPVIEIARAP